MEIKHGNDRVVLTLPRLGIVLKFSKVHLFNALKNFLYDWKYRKTRSIWFRFTWPQNVYGGYQRSLLRGLTVNLREIWFYQTKRHKILTPTYFSLGFVNIQKYGAKYNVDEEGLWTRLSDVVGQDIFLRSHHFHNSENYCICDGFVTMSDYGSVDVIKILEKHGDKIFNALNN